MTLTETDRLIRSLREVLKDPAGGASANAPVLAQQYAESCGAADRRLEQCAAMLDQGDEQQAVQLAETEPPVLDLLTLLSFDKAPAWLAYCQANRLPAAGGFDPRIVQRLNTVYSKGITVNHPLYRDYRAHILKNRPDEAVATLRSIVRLNPSDTNARQELGRLEEKTLRRDLEKLAGAVAAGDERTAVALVDQLEDQRFSGDARPQGPAWEKGLAVRREQFRRQAHAEARATLAQAVPLQAAGKWQAATPMLAHIRALQSEHGFNLDADDARRLADLQVWVGRSQQEHSTQQSYHAALAELESLIEQGEQHHASAGVSALPARREELAALVARWREIEAFERPLPENLETRYRKRAGLARAEIDRLQRTRRNVWVAGSIAAVAAAAALVYFFVVHQRASELAGQLRHLADTQQVGATEKLLTEAHANDAKLFDNAEVRAAAAAADTFVGSAHTRQQEFNTRLATLTALSTEQPAPFASQPPEATNALWTDAQKRFDALPPEYRTAFQAPLAAFRNRWEAFLARESAARNDRFAAALADAEKLAAEGLTYRRAPEELRGSVSALTAALAPLTAQVQSPPFAELKVRDDLATRLTALASTASAFAGEMTRYDTTLKAMRDADTLEAYLTALRASQDLELRGTRELAPTKRILALQPSTENLLSAALMPGNADGWAFFKANPTASFRPVSAVLDPERRIYDGLLVDSNIRNVYTYQYRDPRGKVSTVYSRGTLETSTESSQSGGEVTHVLGSYYLPGAYAGTAAFNDTPLEGSITNGQLAPDSRAFLELRFRELIDSSADRFNPGQQGAPLLEFFDRLSRQHGASPLFKAYLYTRVCQLMMAGKRSGFWGLPFTPALVVHAQQVDRLGAPSSGAWMVPDEIKRKGAAFEQLFAAMAKVSYVQQANVLHEAIREAAANGLAYRGFVDAAGQPQFIGHETESGGAQPDLWGWNARDGLPAKLFVWSAKDARYKPATENAPLTPLFASERDPHEILRAACKRFALTADDYKNSIEPFLPPFFKD